MAAGLGMAHPLLVLQPATEFPPAPFPSPAACLEAEVPQLIPESLVVHGSVVLGLTKVLEEDEENPSVWEKEEVLGWGRGWG